MAVAVVVAPFRRVSRGDVFENHGACKSNAPEASLAVCAAKPLASASKSYMIGPESATHAPTLARPRRRGGLTSKTVLSRSS